MDSTLTANLEAKTVLRLIYIFTRIRPDTKCDKLRCRRYKEMLDCFRKAGQRVQKTVSWDVVLGHLTSNGRGEIKEGVVIAMARDSCFDETWLDEVFDPKGKQQKRGREVTLHESFGWMVHSMVESRSGLE